MCTHRTVAISYNSPLYRTEAHCADCDQLLSTYTDEQAARDPDSINGWASRLGIEPLHAPLFWQAARERW